jgi:hypothetical protein
MEKVGVPLFRSSKSRENEPLMANMGTFIGP